MNEKIPVTHSNTGIKHYVALQIYAAVLFYFCDVLLESRNFWMGWNASEWLSTMPAIPLYGVYFLVATGPVTFLLRSIVLKKIDVRVSTTITTLFAAIILTLILHNYAIPRIEPFVRLYGFIAAGVLTALGLWGRKTEAIGWTVIGGLVGVTAALVLLEVFASILVSFRFGTTITVAYAAGFAFIVLIVSAFAHRKNRSRAKLTVYITFVTFVIPSTIAFFPPQGRITDEPDRKNVLMITADTMRADYLSSYGSSVQTPNLDKLAAKGVRFDQHYSVAPWTVPSFPGIFSSKYPPSVTLDRTQEERREELSYYGQIGDYWEGEEGRSLVQDMTDSGYASGAFVANFALYGFDWLLGDFDNHVVLPFRPYVQAGPLDKLPMLSGVIRKVAPDTYEKLPPDYTTTITKYAQAFLRVKTKGNFFLWAHFLDPHAPYNPPAKFRRITEEPEDYFPEKGSKELEQVREYIRSSYEGEIRHVDESVGKILDTLSTVGRDDDTIIIFTSDHGEEFWEHGATGHGLSLYNEQLRVPLFVYEPGIEPRVIKTPVSAIDVIPTLADMLGRERLSEWRGKSFLSVLQGESEDSLRRPVFSQATGLIPPPPEPLQSVVVWPFKLVRGMETGKSWLFNLEDDPLEMTNLASSNEEQVNQLTAHLLRWSNSFHVTFAELRDEHGFLEANQDAIDRLEALGYLDNEKEEKKKTKD